jgi:WD40 repeat protein
MITSITSVSTSEMASGSYDKTIKIWNWREGILVRSINEHKNYIWALCRIDDETLASGTVGGAKGIISFWKWREGKKFKSLKSGEVGWKSIVVLNERELAHGAINNKIKIWT